MKKVLKRKKGFTLVELLVVIAIIAILSTVSVLGYMGFTENAKESNDLQELTQIKTLVWGETVTSKQVTVSEMVYDITFVENSGLEITSTDDADILDTDAEKVLLALLTDVSENDITVEFAAGFVTEVTYNKNSKNGAVWNVKTNTVSKNQA